MLKQSMQNNEDECYLNEQISSISTFVFNQREKEQFKNLLKEKLMMNED